MTIIQRKGLLRQMFRYRPHHFLCTLGFQGKGYSPDFVKNFSEIADVLRGEDGDEQLIKVIKNCDDICRACPRRSKQLCQQEKTISQLDSGHAEVLGLQFGQIISWGEAKQRIRKNMSLSNFQRVCASCSWRDLGVCEEALTRLHEEEELLRNE